MRAVAKWSVDHSVTVNLLMVLIIVGGIFSVMQMKREAIPQFNLDMIVIGVAYPAAAPPEIEEGICIKIEEAITGIAGIKRISSTSIEGNGTVLVELERGVDDPQRVVYDIKTQLDRIETFPDEAKEPVVQEIFLNEPVIYVAVYGDVPELALRKLAEEVRDDLTSTPHITQAGLMGARAYEISIEISEQDLRKYGLSFDDVTHAVRFGSLDLPGGVIKTTDGNLAIRAKGQRYSAEDFETIPLVTHPDGTTLYLGQIARIVDGFEDTDKKTRFNGKPGVIVNVFKTPGQDVLKIADTVKQYVADRQNALPEGVSLSTFFDQSEIVRSRINLLLRNGAWGLGLVFLVLVVFLRFNLSFWVSMGIPFSFMGGMWILGIRGDTINMISLFGFIMVLGLVVDDAIIIGENIYTRYQKGASPIDAAVEGTAQVGMPVVMTVLTTVVAFAPLFYVGGIMGKFIAIMPVAIIATLIFSLFEALFILPSHLAHSLQKRERKKKSNSPGNSNRFRASIDRGLSTVINQYYDPALEAVIKNRYVALSVAIAIFLIAAGWIKGGHIPVHMFPKTETDWIIAKVTFPFGTSVESTETALTRVEKALERVDQEFADKADAEQVNKHVVRNEFTFVGEIMQEDPIEGEGKYGAHVGQVFVELMPSEIRTISHTEILNRWREETGEIPGIDTLVFSSLAMGPGGSPLAIRLHGEEFGMLEAAADELKEKIATYPGTFDITDDFHRGKPELIIRTKPEARALGITMGDLAKQLRQGFYGDEALRIQRGRDDVKVMVRYTEKERHDRGTIDTMRFRTPSGDEIPFSMVADVTEGFGYSSIHRVDRKRTITVVSDLDSSIANAKQIAADLQAGFLPDLLERYPQVSFSFGGQEEEFSEVRKSLKRGFIIALVGIFCLLATQFRSYIQPLIVMAAIPFGMIGAVVAHIIMGLDLSILSFFGIIALAGIVVNDALVLIDFINQSVRAGMAPFEAAHQAGKARFRAVILTTVTTFAGLFPILMEKSLQAQFLIPMCASIAFGLVFATVLTLLLVPSLYLIVNDITKIFSKPQD